MTPTWIAVALLLLVLSLSVSADEPASDGAVRVGDAAPPFRLNDQDGKAVAPLEAKGWWILAFYPKALTGGCTKEMCSLRDSKDDLAAMGVARYGISLDDVVSQKAFAEKHGLGFPLLSDPDGSVAAKYHVLPKGAAWTDRVTFVVDPKGIVRLVDTKVQVMTHAADLAKAIRELQK